jgi:TRAP-type mannitol/chloroaromatic compound transport system, small permease component
MNAQKRDFGQAVAHAAAWPGKLAGWLILPIIFCVLAAVLGGLFRVSILLEWEEPILLFDTSLTVMSLSEMQWHLFAIMTMLGIGYALHEDRHVRVDVFYAKFSPKGRALVNLIGDIFLLLPLCYFVADFALPFVEMAYKSGEQSDYDGLTHRYLVKAILPIGFVLLAIIGLGRIYHHARVLRDKSPQAATSSKGS